MSNPEIVARLRELLAKATPGPWTVDGPAHNQIVWSDSENRVCFLAHSDGNDPARDIATGHLIVEAVNALPSLLSALTEAAEASEPVALQEATSLAICIWKRRYRTDAPDWKPLPDMRGVISQIDNMAAGLLSDWEATQPAWAHNRASAAERMAKLEEALRPFAERADKLDGKWLDHETHWSPAYGGTEITIGDLRRARSTLKDRSDGED